MPNYGGRTMKRISTVFLQTVIVLIGIGTLALMLWEPHLEGVNAHATLFQVYFTDPFLAYAYLGSVPFFVALYQAFALLGYIGRNKVFSWQSVKALRIIKYCALITAAAIVGADVYLKIAVGIPGTDDPAGAIALGAFATFASVVIATAAAVFETLLHSAVEMKSEQDLTV